MRMDGLETHHRSVPPPKFLCSFITLHSWINTFTPFCFERQSHFFRLLLSVTVPPSEEKFLTKYFHFLHSFLFPPAALSIHLTCSSCALGPTLHLEGDFQEFLQHQDSLGSTHESPENGPPLLNWAELDITSHMLAKGFLRQMKGRERRVSLQDLFLGALQPADPRCTSALESASDLALTSFWIRKKCYFSPLEGCQEKKYLMIWNAGHTST